MYEKRLRNYRCRGRAALEYRTRLSLQPDQTGKLQGKKVNGRWTVSAQAIETRAKITRNGGNYHATTGR